MRFVVAFVLLAGAAFPVAARAQAPAAPPPAASPSEEAKRLFEEARKDFNLGEFRSAAENYKKAYRLKPDPALLYNIGQAYRLGGDMPNALFFYRTFLRNATDVPPAVKKEVEGRIKQIEEMIATGKPPTLPPKPEPTKPEPVKTTEPTTSEPTKPAPNLNLQSNTTAVESKPVPAYKKWWVWTIVGIAVVGVGVGVGVGVALSQPKAPGSELGTFKAFE